VIAHRLATAQKADRIVVLETAAAPTRLHSHLTQRHLYARSAALQFSRRHGEDGKAASLTVAAERRRVRQRDPDAGNSLASSGGARP